MCGRYSLITESALRKFGAAPDESFEPRYNCAPGQELPVITAERPRHVERVEWGYVPEWADDSTTVLNARAETVREKPSFRESFERRRCLIPADGYYEWADDGPYRITAEGDRAFAMAGVWTEWAPETTQTGLDAFGAGTPQPTPTSRKAFAILTTGASDAVAEIHHRMPAMLTPGAASTWLDGPGDTAESLLGPREGLELHPVSTRVNDPRNDSPDVAAAVER